MFWNPVWSLTTYSSTSERLLCLQRLLRTGADSFMNRSRTSLSAISHGRSRNLRSTPDEVPPPSILGMRRIDRRSYINHEPRGQPWCAIPVRSATSARSWEMAHITAPGSTGSCLLIHPGLGAQRSSRRRIPQVSLLHGTAAAEYLTGCGAHNDGVCS